MDSIRLGHINIIDHAIKKYQRILDTNDNIFVLYFGEMVEKELTNLCKEYAKKRIKELTKEFKEL